MPVSDDIGKHLGWKTWKTVCKFKQQADAQISKADAS